MIHETAIIDPSAHVGKDVTIGPYSVVGPGCSIGNGTAIGSHVVVAQNCTIGEHNRIYSHAAIGGDPQDLKYKGEKTWAVLGEGNTIREFVTINRGTGEGGGKTVIGSGNLLMAYAHVAHDCMIGNGVVMANAVTLGGHVEIHDHVVMGGLTGVHQFARIGAHAIVGALSAVGRDIPPYVTASITRGRKRNIFGLNLVGLRRRGFSKEKIDRIKEAVKLMGNVKLTAKELVDIFEKEFTDSEEVAYMADFFKNTTRGIKRT